MAMRAIVPALLVVCACGGKGAPAPDAAPDGAANVVDASPDASFDAGPCPDQAGAYSIALTGAGCGNLNASASECITQNACDITLATTGGGLAGTAALGMDGSFSGAAITEGTVNRTGCTGTWNPSTSQLTVDCGGVGSSQSCIATLTRTASTCQ